MGIFDFLRKKETKNNSKQNSHKTRVETTQYDTYMRELLEDLSFEQIPKVFHLISSTNQSISDKAIDKICSTIGFNNFTKLIQLDKNFRMTSSLTLRIDYTQVSLSKYAPDNIKDDQMLKLVGLVSFHPSGYYREQALLYMRKNENPFFLPFIILRINDWVPVIRKIAIEVIISIIENIDPFELLKNIPLINHIGRYTRHDNKEIQYTIFRKIAENSTQEDIIKVLHEPNEKIRIAIIKFLAINNKISEIIINHVIEKEHVPMIRLFIYQFLQKNGWRYDSEKTINYLQNEKFYNCKIILLEQLISMESLNIHLLLLRYLTDKSLKVRNFVRSYIDPIEYRSIYLKNINESKKLKYSIIGLSECGVHEDCSLIESFLNNNDESIINAALTGISNIKENISYDEMKGLIFNGSESTSNLTTRIIKKNIDDSDIIDLVDNMENEYPDYLYNNIINLISCSSKWNRIYYFIKFIDHKNINVSRKSNLGIRSWIDSYNRSYISPNKDQVTRLLTIIDEKSEMMGYLGKNIKFTIDSLNL
jgi:hypothetical protein